MGLFAEILHLHPWDVERLTVRQFDAYARYVEQRIKKG